MPEGLGRRERNKQLKLDRITTAASELFASRGVDDVTTQEIADAADVGAGTLFLYARNKGELLLLVQNSHYEDALLRGRDRSLAARGVADAVMAIIAEIVECNRIHVGNGRAYLKEMAFGDSDEPHHAAALQLSAQTEKAVAEAIERELPASAPQAATLAHIVTAIMFVALAGSHTSAWTTAQVNAHIADQVALLQCD